jgi:hypothetical protein
MRIVVLTLTVLFATTAHGAAQQPTLRQLAFEHKGNLVMMRIGCGWSDEPIKLIVQRAGVMLVGTVLSKRSYPTADDTDIFTDFEISPEQILFQRVNGLAAGVPMTFKTNGGTVTFDGYAFMYDVQLDGRRVTMDVGDQVVLFGSYDSKDRKWLFTPIDVFELRGDVVVSKLPEIEPFKETLPSQMTVGAFGERVRELAARLR